MEIWKDIKGFPGYQVSNEGRVRSHDKVTTSARFPERHWKDRIIKQKWQNGRARVDLWKENGEHKTLQVHRLMGFAFLGEPTDPSMTINHKDGNPRNNTLDNIEWMTLGDNIRYGFENGQYRTKMVTIKKDDAEEYHVFNSMRACDRFLGRCSGYTSAAIIEGRRLLSAEGITFRACRP